MDKDDNSSSKTRVTLPRRAGASGSSSQPPQKPGTRFLLAFSCVWWAPCSTQELGTAACRSWCLPYSCPHGDSVTKAPGTASTDWQPSPLCVSNPKYRTSDLLVHQENAISQCFTFHQLSGAVRCNLEGFGLGEVLERKSKWHCSTDAHL